MKISVTVTLNGGPTNPWGVFGLTANPFPQMPRFENASGNAVLQRLDSDPIPDVAALRAILKGCAPDFIALCEQHYVPGQRTRFTVTWSE